MNSFFKISFFAALVLTGRAAYSQTTFTATLSQDTIGIDEQVQLTFQVQNAQQVEELKAPNLDDFVIISGPNQQSNITMINGDVKQSIGISYIIKPKNTGNFTIREASAKVNGKVMYSNKLTLTVSGSSVPKNKKQDDKKQENKNPAPVYPNQNFTFVGTVKHSLS